MDSSNETQHGFMSTEDIPFHFLRRETYRRLLDTWRQIHTHFMIYDRTNMEDELLRLITFLHFPGHTGQDIRILAIAGFYYYGESDIVVCYCCGLWRRNWTNTDEPWAIHKRLSVRCLFIRNNREVNRPYYGITERGLRNLEQTTRLLQQATVASGPSFVRSGHEIQAGIISGILRREQYNNRVIERVERHNILPVANLQRRETHVGDLHMGVEMRNSHAFYLDIESRIISIANERRNRTCNIPHLGRILYTSELSTDIAQSHPYTPPNENNSGILESIETSIQRRYGNESEGFDEEADRSGVQNMHSTFCSVQDETDSTSGDETVPKQVVRVPTTLANSNFSRRLLRSISEPLPYQYSYRAPRHIYTENTNCYIEYSRCTNESTDTCYSVTNELLASNDKHIEQSNDDNENTTLLRASGSEEIYHEPVTVSYDNTGLEEYELEETIVKRSHSKEDEAETKTKIESRDFTDKILEALVSDRRDDTSKTGSRSESLTRNITDTETTLIENIDHQYHLPRNTHTTDSKNVLNSSIQIQESLSNDEESASGVTDTDLVNPSLLATPEKDLTDRTKKLSQKKNTTFCETHTEDKNHPNELRENVRIPKTESDTTAPSESEQAVAEDDSIVNTMKSITNQNTNYGSFQSTKSKITQISEIVEEPAESESQLATNVESPKMPNKCLEGGSNVSIREELDQINEVNEDSSPSQLFSVLQRQDSLLDTEESETAGPDGHKRKEMSMQRYTGITNISVLMNRQNGNLTSEFNSVHQHSMTNIEQIQRMPDDFQKASSLDNINGARMNDPLLTSINISTADQEDQPRDVCQSKGHESSMGCDDICIRPSMKARQRHLSEGDSPHYISLGPRCKPHTIQQNYSTVESRRRSFRNNSVSPSEQLADAGFYSAGRDYIRCFSCGIELQHSKLDNNIWIEHAKASPRCEYLLQRKGQDFIKAIIEGDDEHVQLYLNIFTAECRRKPFNADRASEGMNETVSEDAFEGVVLKCYNK